MLKAKGVIQIEINQKKIPSNWLDELKNIILSSLDNTMVHFGTESKGVIKVKEVDLTEMEETMDK